MLRCIAACCIDLGNDEAYYFTYALQPDWNHFDHPPAVGLLIRFFTLNLHWLNEFSMRAGAIVCGAIATWLIAAIGRKIKNERTGFIAAVLYNTSLYTSIISGLFILPDSPAVLFWLAAIYCAIFLIRPKDNEVQPKYLLLFGIWAGLATMCKVHGIFLWVGMGAYVLLHDRRWLSGIHLYVSFLITAIIVTPIIVWNVQNDFVTWNFHSERVEVNSVEVNFQSALTTILGSVFYNNPLNILLFTWCGRSIARKRQFTNNSVRKFLLWCSLPVICTTILISFFRTVLPHWSGPGFIPLMLIAAVWIDKKIALTSKSVYTRLLWAAAYVVLFILIAGIGVVRYLPSTLGKKNNTELGAGDFTLDMYGWKEIRPVFDSVRQADIKSNNMQPSSPLVVHKWFPGGHLLFYVGHPLQMQTIGIGMLQDLHKFIWLNKDQGPLHPGGNAYFIVPSNYFTNPSDIYINEFKSVEKAATIPQYRSGVIVRYWYIYRLKHYGER